MPIKHLIISPRTREPHPITSSRPLIAALYPEFSDAKPCGAGKTRQPRPHPLREGPGTPLSLSVQLGELAGQLLSLFPLRQKGEGSHRRITQSLILVFTEHLLCATPLLGATVVLTHHIPGTKW